MDGFLLITLVTHNHNQQRTLTPTTEAALCFTQTIEKPSQLNRFFLKVPADTLELFGPDSCHFFFFRCILEQEYNTKPSACLLHTK